MNIPSPWGAVLMMEQASALAFHRRTRHPTDETDLFLQVDGRDGCDALARHRRDSGVVAPPLETGGVVFDAREARHRSGLRGEEVHRLPRVEAAREAVPLRAATTEPVDDARRSGALLVRDARLDG